MPIDEELTRVDGLEPAKQETEAEFATIHDARRSTRDAPFITPSQIERANRLFALHWRTPEEPWTPRCEDCRDGTCPRERWADKIIGQCMEMMLG